MMLTISSGHCTLAGKREVNEDFVGMVTPEGDDLDTKGIIAALADGVSGSSGGREASEYAVRGLLADYYATPDTWETPLALDRVLNAINRWMMSQRSTSQEREGMATTLTAMILRGRRYTLAHIGDSRAYLLRAGKLTRLTTDHVWDRPEMHHVLTRAMGLDARLAMDYSDGELETGDVFMLCSDGVWEPLGDAGVQKLLEKDLPAAQLATELCDTAIAAGSQDNASSLVVRIKQLPDTDLRDAQAATANLPIPPRLTPGQTIDDFRVVEVLHESRVTLLYKVRDLRGGGIYALKTLHPNVGDDPIEIAALTHEEWLSRRVVARFFPQHIPVDSERRNHLYFVMSWHEGGTLQKLIDAGRHLTIPDALQHTIRLVRGIGALHRRSILHRDIKPANIHLGTDGELRILDLGVALSGHEPKREAGMAAGTPSFIAPEQFSGALPTPQMDLYAAGVTLYYMLTRKYPYGEVEPFQRPKFGEAVPPTRYRPDIPLWLENVILKACARDPKNRFETAEEFLLALERGASRPIAAPAPMSLAEREPLLLWRSVAIASIVLNLLLLYLLVIK